jgi:predicted PurR-regulated permease PerM
MHKKINIKLPALYNVTIALLFFLLAFFILTNFQNYLRPITLGVLFAYLLFPIANYIENKGVNRIFANIISILIGITVLVGVVLYIYYEATSFLTDIPGMKVHALKNINTIFSSIEEFLGTKSGEIKSSLTDFINNAFNNSAEIVKSLFTGTFNTLFAIFIMPVYVFFLLFYRNKFKKFILMLVPEHNHHKAEKIINEVNKVGIKYITGVFIVVTILVFINSIGFLIIGLKFAALLGLFAALMNFIPYYGTIIGYSLPFFLSVFVMDSPKYAFLVFFQFIVVQFTENNILTPNIVGSHVNINPFMIILAITFGGFVWGLPGMFIAVPFAAALRVVSENIESLKPLGFLLGQQGAEEHAVSLNKIKNVFKKKN